MSSTESFRGGSGGASDRGADTDDGDGDGNPPEAVCPFCGSGDTERESRFGGEVSKSQYYCNGCRTVFERIKYDGAIPSTGRDRDGTR
ncbi:hypothetical protein [Haloferax sulfurifontis]|uniref:PaaD zinc beta ribbon domain-containing protein n=1 Tax=Haloferax sulfurifontis TaxID=255616 RepID=A0A830DWL8_9EURY|nr:hypothetical protein [Haloferax sulfurifontis]GGC66477.1 hypothetical protein GCM10007209_30710 [Haloferax sulfurifontis]